MFAQRELGSTVPACRYQSRQRQQRCSHTYGDHGQQRGEHEVVARRDDGDVRQAETNKSKAAHAGVRRKKYAKDAAAGCRSGRVAHVQSPLATRVNNVFSAATAPQPVPRTTTRCAGPSERHSRFQFII